LTTPSRKARCMLGIASALPIASTSEMLSNYTVSFTLTTSLVSHAACIRICTSGWQAQDRALNAATQADNAFKAARGACSASISLNHRLYQHISQQLYSQRNPTTSLVSHAAIIRICHLGAAGRTCRIAA
jgi:hypothetical protein